MSVQVSAHPGPSTTTVRLHEPDVSYDGSPRHITVIAAEQLSVQFTTPREALAWLAHCSTLVSAAWDRQADDMAGVVEADEAGEVKSWAERDAARADNLRLRELLFDVRCCPIEHVARSYVTVQIDRPTWEALHAIDARTEQVPL